MASRRVFSTLSHLTGNRAQGLPRSIRAAAPLPTHNLPKRKRIPSVQHVIAVSSAKGGVGKSTIAANLALSLAQRGLRTGILDADVFGPSIPTLFNLSSAGTPHLTPSNLMLPLTNYGVKTMSMGYLIPPDAPIVWRGLMVTQSVQQLLHKVEWGGLDTLVLDMPPGTGDVQLTVAQQVAVDGAVVVSTPQDLALKDAVRGIEMFRKVDVPVLGIVENMAYFTCPKCEARTHVFAHRRQGEDEHGKPKRHSSLWDGLGVPVLGSIPLAPQICADADAGKPTVVMEPSSERAVAFSNLAEAVMRQLEEKQAAKSKDEPS